MKRIFGRLSGGSTLWNRTFFVLFIITTIFLMPQLWSVISSITNNTLVLTGFSEAERALVPLTDVFMLVIGFLVFIGFFFFILIVASSSALPVGDWLDRIDLIQRVVLLAIGVRGAAVFVKEGQLITSREDDELTRDGPGVVLVDFNSAIAIRDDSNPSVSRDVDLTRRKTGWRARLEETFNREEFRAGPIRIAGPGLTFLEGNERIDENVIDLRRQTRMGKGIRGNTRDGIEVSTNISVLFTLGEKPDTFYIGKISNTVDGIRVIDVKDDDVVGVYDILRPEEKEEIFRMQGILKKGKYFDEGEIEELVDPNAEYSEYHFDAKRIFSAVRAKSLRDTNIQAFSPLWTDLPIHDGTVVFRDLIVTEDFDELYLPNDPHRFPLKDIKEVFAWRMKVAGVFNYKYIEHIRTETISKGMSLGDKSIAIYASREMQTTKNRMLRAHGIKMLNASFGDLTPMNELVLQQRIRNWIGKEEKKTQITRAERELDEMRFLSQTRAQSQRDNAQNLAPIFEFSDSARQALTIRLFQAVEALASDPEARKEFSTKELIATVAQLKDWLAPEYKDKSTKKPGKIKGGDDA